MLNRAIPRDLETIVLKAVAKAPKDRYATAWVGSYSSIYNGDQDGSQTTERLLENIAVAIDEVAEPVDSPTGVKLILGTMGEMGVLPYVQGDFNWDGVLSVADIDLLTSAMYGATASVEEPAVVDESNGGELFPGLDELVSSLSQDRNDLDPPLLQDSLFGNGHLWA